MQLSSCRDLENEASVFLRASISSSTNLVLAQLGSDTRRRSVLPSGAFLVSSPAVFSGPKGGDRLKAILRSAHPRPKRCPGNWADGPEGQKFSASLKAMVGYLFSFPEIGVCN